MKEVESLAYIPDMDLESRRLDVVAGVTSGLVDRYLRFAEKDDSPTSDIPDKDYGFRLMPESETQLVNPRPMHEDIDWRSTATRVLGLRRETPFPVIADLIRSSFDDWTPFVERKFKLNERQLRSYVRARDTSFYVGTLTEDNLNGYGEVISEVYKRSRRMETLRKLMREHAAWRGNEDSHGRTMNAYGEITDLVGGRQYTASRTSQLRTGSSEQPGHVTGLKVFSSVQEFMANTSHMNNAGLFEPVGFELVSETGGQESWHGSMFQRETSALIKEFPDDVVSTLYEIMHRFEMPGSRGIANYKGLAAIISAANLLRPTHAEAIFKKMLSAWGICGPKKDVELEKSLRTYHAKMAFQFFQEFYDNPITDDLPPTKNDRFVLGATATSQQLGALRTEYKQTIMELHQKKMPLSWKRYILPPTDIVDQN